MSKLHVNIPHQLPQQEALIRIKKMLGELKNSQKDIIENVKEDWQGNAGHFSFTAKGYDLSGIITVGPAMVDVDAEIPFVLSLFKGKIINVIRDKATELLT